MISYSVHIDPQADGGFVVTVPSLPGCISEGGTLEEAFSNIEDAISGYLYVLKKKGSNIPLELNAFARVSVSSESLIHA